MRTEIVEFWGYRIKKHYMYRPDLEKLDTRRLLWILGRLRSYFHCLDWDYFEQAPPGEDLDNTWIEYAKYDCGSKLLQEEYYAMFWMVKDVLSRREHIPTSKVERKKIRQERAKKRYDRRSSTHFCGKSYSRG